MKRLILAVLIIGLSFSICEGNFFEKFLESSIENSKTSRLDFGDSWNFVDNGSLDLEVENTGECELLVRVRFFPVVVQENLFYRMDLGYNFSMNSECWQERGDGYFYYKQILDSGESLVDRIDFEVEYQKKDDRKLLVEAYVETLQAKNGACENVWNVEEVFYEEVS